MNRTVTFFGFFAQQRLYSRSRVRLSAISWDYTIKDRVVGLYGVGLVHTIALLLVMVKILLERFCIYID